MPRVQRSELQEFLRRTEAAQRLQGGSRLRSRRVALDSGSVDFFPGFRRAAMGDEDIHHRHHPRISGGADFFVGVEITLPGRNQTRNPRLSLTNRSRGVPEAKIIAVTIAPGCRRGRSVRVSTRAFEINNYASIRIRAATARRAERGGYNGA